jgi:hypothetical protein
MIRRSEGTDEGLTIQDVIFRAQMEIITLSGKIHGLENDFNIDNFYNMIRTTWAIIAFWLPQEALDKKKKLYSDYNGRYEVLQKQAKADFSTDRNLLVNLKFNLSIDMLQMMSEALAESGLLKERSAEAYSGTGVVKIMDGRVIEEEAV